MRRLLPTLRTCAAGWLLAAGCAVMAATPATPEDALASVQAAYARAVPPGVEAAVYGNLIAGLFERVQRHYATEIDLPAFATAALGVLEPLPPGASYPAEVFKLAMNEALRTLDPYSRYLDARAHTDERSRSSGRFVGIGVELEAGEGAVRVVASLPGSPAERAGLLRGDLIVGVDAQPLAGLALAEAIARMRGEVGTPVSLTIRRPGQEHEITVALTRETIRRQILRWSMEGDVLVLRLGGFTTAVSSALRQAVEEASAAHAPRAVILDMRGNGGGLLREAVRTADAFLAQGEIASLRGRTPATQRTWKADDAELLPGAPMVVLVDGRSASAAELVAVALQENGRARVMGQRSYGKGTVQTTFPLGEQKGALKLTTSLYLGPSGRPVQSVGVAPDIELVTGSTVKPTEGAVRVEQSRCTALRKAADAALACALAYLDAGSVAAFSAALAAQPGQP